MTPCGILIYEQGVVDLLQQFERGGMDARVQQYASGCLANVRRTIAAEQARQEEAKERQEDARPVPRVAKLLTAVTGVTAGPASRGAPHHAVGVASTGDAFSVLGFGSA